MPVYSTPGVYIEEIERGPRPIEGVPTSVAAFLGETERGPDMPRLVTSYREYTRLFGTSIQSGQFMPFAVNGFFENGGQQLYVARIVGRGAAIAKKAFGDIGVEALGRGEYGNDIWVRVSESTTKARNPKNANALEPIGFRLFVGYWPDRPHNFTGFDPTDDKPSAGGGGNAGPGGGAQGQAKDGPPPEFYELFDDLSVDPASPDYFEKRVNESSALVQLTVLKNEEGDSIARPEKDESGFMSGGSNDPNELTVTDYVGAWDDPQEQNGGQPADDNKDKSALTGLSALELDPYRDVSLVYAPHPRTDAKNIAQAVVDHCERNKFRFAAIDCDKSSSNINELKPRDDVRDSAYAAYYYPWIWVANPRSGLRTLVPPGGHALGVYARVDSVRGVYKAPANEVPRGATRLEFDINDKKQAVLNPRGVNVIRTFPGRGILIWGARTMSSNSLWKYIPVRRLFIFIERSIYEGTQWVVFEPNDAKLWVRVKDSIRLFLRTQWRDGALFGTTEDEAFFITCDRSTMTQDDILNGRLICEIGIAPVRPAEFVVFRIFQNTADPQR
jgi:phage tail sheath protein FI